MVWARGEGHLHEADPASWPEARRAAAFFGDDRYHIVVVPVLCILAAAALQPPNADEEGGRRRGIAGVQIEMDELNSHAAH